MNTKSRLGITAAILVAIAALAYANRIYLLQYSLGWYTDVMHPRSGEKSHCIMSNSKWHAID